MLKLTKLVSAIPSGCGQFQAPKKLFQLPCVQFSSNVFSTNSLQAPFLQNETCSDMKLKTIIGGQRTYMNMTSKSKKKTSERKLNIDGIDLNFKEEGEGSHIILCLPGLVGTIATDFGPIFNEMNKSKFRLISWDPPGHGKSRPPNRDHASDYYIKDAHLVAKLMEKLGHEKYSVLGWATGGTTGYTLAADFPENVTHLVIWGAHAYFDDKVLATGLGASETKNWPQASLKAMTEIYGKEYLEATLANWAESTKELVRSGDAKRLTNRIPSVKCPTLVIHGQKDSIIGMEHAQYIADHIRNSRLQLMPSGNHSLHLTSTEDFLNLIEPFLLNKDK